MCGTSKRQKKSSYDDNVAAEYVHKNHGYLRCLDRGDVLGLDANCGTFAQSIGGLYPFRTVLEAWDQP